MSSKSRDLPALPDGSKEHEGFACGPDMQERPKHNRRKMAGCHQVRPDTPDRPEKFLIISV